MSERWTAAALVKGEGRELYGMCVVCCATVTRDNGGFICLLITTWVDRAPITPPPSIQGSTKHARNERVVNSKAVLAHKTRVYRHCIEIGHWRVLRLSIVRTGHQLGEW